VRREKNIPKKSFSVLLFLTLVVGNSLLIGVAFAETTITRYAVLVSGTLDPDLMCTQLDTQYMYHVLVGHYGMKPDNICYLHANTSYPYNGVDVEATKANVTWAINTWLKSRSTANDMVFIYMTSHGGGYWKDENSITSFARIDGSQGDPVDEGTEFLNGTGVDEGIRNPNDHSVILVGNTNLQQPHTKLRIHLTTKNPISSLSQSMEKSAALISSKVSGKTERCELCLRTCDLSIPTGGHVEHKISFSCGGLLNKTSSI